jgi:hypothetical protein
MNRAKLGSFIFLLSPLLIIGQSLMSDCPLKLKNMKRYGMGKPLVTHGSG